MFLNIYAISPAGKQIEKGVVTCIADGEQSLEKIRVHLRDNKDLYIPCNAIISRLKIHFERWQKEQGLN